MNSKKWNTYEPTPELEAQIDRAAAAIGNEVELLSKEVPVACILSALGGAIVHLIAEQAELAAVAPWFEAQAEMAREVENRSIN